MTCAASRESGTRRAATLKAAAALADRMVHHSDERPVLSSPQDVADYLHDLAHAETEHLRVILLDTRNRPLRKLDVYQGSVNTSLIRIGEVFRDAVRANAASVIVAHNHPSGDPSPSPEDVAVTRAMVEAGRLLDIEVLDHLILSSGRVRLPQGEGPRLLMRSPGPNRARPGRVSCAAPAEPRILDDWQRRNGG